MKVPPKHQPRVFFFIGLFGIIAFALLHKVGVDVNGIYAFWFMLAAGFGLIYIQIKTGYALYPHRWSPVSRRESSFDFWLGVLCSGGVFISFSLMGLLEHYFG